MSESLVYIGKIIALETIPNADFIVSATVVCGKGGRWRGVVKKGDYYLGSLCIVYLPDAVVQPSKDMEFLKNSKWRVRMQRFRGAPSEVVIMPYQYKWMEFHLGDDITGIMRVEKYIKEVPESLNGLMRDTFPDFIPKTDEPNYQSHEDLVKALIGKPYYIAEKADGASTTAYKYKDFFGVCSRNLDLLPDRKNGYWKVADKYDLANKLPEGLALQWETCGPKIQKNPLGFTQAEGLAFSAYDIVNQKYLEAGDFYDLCTRLEFPTVRILKVDQEFSAEGIELLGEGTYPNGKQREGVVVRSKFNELGHKPISFKVINLNYET